MNERLNMGVQEELLDLMTIHSLKPEKARILYDAGITTPEELHRTSQSQILKILEEGECFMSKKASVSIIRISYILNFTVPDIFLTCFT